MASEVISTTIKLLGKLDPSVQKAMSTAEKTAGSTGKKISAAMIAGFAAVSAAAVATVKQIADIGDEYKQASNKISAVTGATGEALTGLQDVMKNVYADNFGENMNDVANAISNVKQQMSDLDSIKLENITKQAFMLRDTFKYDISESIRAANAITDQFGVDAEYAMNLIATGAQNGLDYSGELLDTISEYSVQFAKIGFSADDMFKILQTGADMGSWNLDKVGDAIKELSIRVIDGSDTTKQGFDAINLNAEKMANQFALGGESARKAFFETVSALANMDDKVQQNIAGVNLFGTMWEDLGSDVVLALSSINDKAYASKDAFENINNVRYDSLSSALEGISRKVDVALLPIGTYLANAGIEAINFVSDVDNITNAFDNAINAIQPFSPLIAGVATAIAIYAVATQGATVAQTIHNGVMALGTTIAGGFGAAMTAVNWPLLAVAAAIGVVIAIGVALWQNWDTVKQKASELVAWLSAKWGEIKTNVGSFIQSITTSFSNGFSALVSIVKAPFDKILGFISSVQNAVGNLWSKITGAKNDAATIKVPAYATGGTVTTPHLAVVGDAPETIVPHGNTPHNRALLAEAVHGVGGGFGDTYAYNINFNVSVNGGSANIKKDILDAEQELERRMDEYFAKKQRRQFA